MKTSTVLGIEINIPATSAWCNWRRIKPADHYAWLFHGAKETIVEIHLLKYPVS